MGMPVPVITTASTVILVFIISTADITIHGSIMDTTDEKDACYICRCFIYEEGIYVDCSSLHLKSVPKNIPEASFFINLTNNNLEHIPENVFSNATKLTYLYLAKNRLRTLPERLLAHNTEIREISLSENQLQRLPLKLFATTERLQRIAVLHNVLENLPEKIFAYPNNLERINLEDNLLEHLPHNIFSNTPTLETLSLRKNRLRELPENLFAQTLHIMNLDFTDNNISIIPETLFNSSHNLRILGLSKNQIRYLPEKLFENTPLLEALLLDVNRLTDLHENVFSKTTYIGILTLDNNQLGTIPENLFAHTYQLQQLELFHNNIHHLPPSIFNATQKLKTFLFSQTNLTDLPELLFSRTPHLNQLSFSGGKISSLPSGLFRYTKELRFLDFARNKLSSLPETLFRDVFLTQMIDFSRNKIKEIPEKLFSLYNRSHDLKQLFFHRNNLSYIHNGIFRDLPKLEIVTFFGNKIQTIESNVFFKCTSLRQIYLFRNELVKFSFESFSTRANLEIHLYGNNVTSISGKSDQETNVSRILYINCEDSLEIQKVNTRMICVSPQYVPEIRLNRSDPVEMYVAGLLRFEGFACYLDVATQETICEICPQGTYCNAENECMYCPEGGFYQDEIGATIEYVGYMKCKNCSAGTYVKNGGGTSPEDCIHCPDGTNNSMHAGFRACFCKDGYARRNRFEECYLCQQPGRKCTNDFESPKPGYYWNWSFPNASVSEYNAFVHNLLDLTLWYDNHTQYYGEIPRVYKCPRPSSCMSDVRQNGSVETTCNEQYQGWLCSKCKNGFHQVFNMCVLCPSGIITLLEVFLLICFVTVLCHMIWWKYKEKPFENYERHTADVFVSRLKLALGFYQVIGEYVVSFDDVSLEGTVHLIGEIISLIRLNILKFFIRPQCISSMFVMNPKVEFIFAMFAVFAFTVLPFIFYQIMKISFKIRYNVMISNGRLTNLRAQIFTFVVIALFICFPPICTSVFQLYPGTCRTFCLDLNDAHCFTVLRSDYDVSCDDHFKLYQVFAVITSIGYVFTFPLVLFFLLWKSYSKPVYLSKDTNRPEMMCDRKVESTPPLSNHSGQLRVPLYLKFLCENYKPHYWYWEILELARKVTQTVLITLLGWDNKLAVLLTVGISVLFLTLHARHRPMKSVREQHLQMFSLAAILTNVVFFAVEIPDKYKDALSWFLMFLNISVIVIIILEAFVTVLVKIKNKLLNAQSSTCYLAEKQSQSSTKMLTEKAK